MKRIENQIDRFISVDPIIRSDISDETGGRKAVILITTYALKAISPAPKLLDSLWFRVELPVKWLPRGLHPRRSSMIRATSSSLCRGRFSLVTANQTLRWRREIHGLIAIPKWLLYFLMKWVSYDILFLRKPPGGEHHSDIPRLRNQLNRAKSTIHLCCISLNFNRSPVQEPGDELESGWNSGQCCIY